MLTVTATDLKNNTADIINHAYYNSPVVVTRNGKPIIQLTPLNQKQDKKDLASVWKSFYGSVPNLPSAREIRKSFYVRKNRTTW